MSEDRIVEAGWVDVDESLSWKHVVKDGKELVCDACGSNRRNVLFKGLPYVCWKCGNKGMSWQAMQIKRKKG